MAGTVFLLLITISGVIASDSYYSSSSLSFDQLITDLDTSLLDGYFQRNASSPSSPIPDSPEDFKFNDLNSNQTRSRRNADPLSDKLSDQDIQFTSNLTSNQTRSRRNADPLSDYSGKLSTVARISNGISLLAGLINKNIPIDTVIQELLHFGNVKLADVVALQKDKVETALTDLESTKTGMDTTGIVGSLEDNTIGMSRVREAFIESDFGNFKHPADYFKEAQSFKDDTTDYSVVKSTTTAVKEALERIEKLENPPSEINVENSGVFNSHITVLRGRLASIESAPASFATIVQNLESLGKLNNSRAILKPVQQMLDLVVLYPKLPNVRVDYVAKAGNNMDKIKSISTKFAESASSNFLVLNDFVTSRLDPSLTRLQYTPGFPNGASDLKLLTKDIRDPSFEATMGTGKNFAKLSGGLKPLTDWSVKLDASESALKPIATSEILQSAANAAKLHTLVSGLSVTSEVAVSVARLMIDNKPTPFSDVTVTPVVKLMENAVQISEELARIKSSASAFPPPPQEVTDVKEILEKLPAKTDENDVQAVIDELKKVPEKVKKVAEHLKELQEFLKNVPDPTATRQTADLVFQADGELQSFKTEIDKYVIPKLVTIKDSKEPIDSVVRALKASKIIKDFKPDDITNIRSAVDTITQALPSIKELQKTPTSRKKRQTNNVKELVKLKDAQKTSGALGSAAASINSMSQLKGMETTVVQDLKTKSTNFTTEVAKVTDVSKKSEILKKWGDHKAFISSLDSTLGQIKDFGAKLSVDKDLRKLGAQLEASKTVSDVKQSISDKSEAVGLLILETSDAKAKTELEALKTQLDSLAALDLQFSNHHSAFPAVPDALKSFFDFLTKFVTPEDTSAAVAAAASAAAAAAAANATDTGIYIGSGVGGAVVLVLIVILVWYLHKRHTRDKIKGWPAMKVWIVKNYFKNLTHAIGLARSLMNEMDKEVIEPKKKTKDLMRMRYPEMEVFMDTAVCLPDGRFINANWIKTMGEARFIATQGPLEEERAKDKEKTLLKYDTRGDFLYMIIVHQTEFVVQLCKWVEEQEDADKRKERRAREIKEEQDIFDGPADKKEEGLLKLAEKMKRAYDARMKDKAAKYYEEKVGESMQIGVYTVTTDSLEETDYGDLEIRKLTIKDKEGKTLHSFTHIFNVAWPDHGIPNAAEPVIKALLMVTQSKKPIVVHCSAGVGRTMSFIGGEVLARDAERHPKKRTSEMFIPLRQSRYRGMQTAAQCYLSMVLSIGLLIERHGKSDPQSKEIWKKHLDHYTFVREKMADEDLGEKRRQEKEDFYENLAKKRAMRDEERVKRHLADLKAGAKKKESRLDSQADSVQIENETTPQAKERTGKETPMTTPTTVTPKQRAVGGGEHVAIDMESEE